MHKSIGHLNTASEHPRSNRQPDAMAQEQKCRCGHLHDSPSTLKLGVVRSWGSPEEWAEGTRSLWVFRWPLLGAPSLFSKPESRHAQWASIAQWGQGPLVINKIEGAWVPECHEEDRSHLPRSEVVAQERSPLLLSTCCIVEFLLEVELP